MACLVDVNNWMRANLLRLDADKTQLIWLGSRHQLEKINIADVQFMSANPQPLPSVRNLGVILDNRLSMADQVTAICQACYYQLRQLHSVVQLLTPEATKTLVHAFISCRLDNCNALLHTAVTALRTDWRPSFRNEISRDLDTPRATREIHIRRQVIWNSLPPAIRDPRSVTVQSGFQETAKDSPVWITIAVLVHLNWRLRNVLTYLLTYLLTYILTYR